MYLALGKTRFASQDFTRVLELKPDFTAARLQRAIVHMKTGEYQLAAEDFAKVVSSRTFETISVDVEEETQTAKKF